MGRRVSAAPTVPQSLVNFFSAGGVQSAIAINARHAKPILSGATTANNLVTALSIAGAGCLKFLALAVNDTTARTIRIKVTIDGVVVFDPGMSSSITTANVGVIAVGDVEITSLQMNYEQVMFNSSLLVEIASSVASETDKMTLYEVHETR